MNPAGEAAVWWQIAVWYATVQLLALALLPLALRVGRELPDRGLTMSKVLGILVIGVVLWLGVSYGLLRNDRGGAWLVLLVTAAVVWGGLHRDVVTFWVTVWSERRGLWGHLVAGEVVFAATFIAWAFVRAHDPAANHTEQPMDLMFMNSIWASPTYPPQDAWFAGYAISYYYLGYWLLVTVGRLAEIAPAVAYNVGQACWYGLLWLGAYGLTVNLVTAHPPPVGRDASAVVAARIGRREIGVGLFGGMAVVLAGNLQVIFEWLYAHGVLSDTFARTLGVHNFPERATRSGQWFISYDWWWWRSSRVVEDLDLFGNHIEVIDEFPSFSYLLGDNHPHVLAMPVVLLVVALALNVYLGLARQALFEASERAATIKPDLDGAASRSGAAALQLLTGKGWPGGALALLTTVGVTGSLVFLNTWDFPPYWALLVAVAGITGVTASGQLFVWSRAIVVGLALAGGTAVIYLPYFLTVQSQAGGVIPNLFYPTRLSQFLVMFGGFAPALLALLVWAWRQSSVTWREAGAWIAAVVGSAAVVLIAAAMTALITEGGRGLLGRVALPEGLTYGGAIATRWAQQPWTLLLTGSGLGITAATLFAAIRSTRAPQIGADAESPAIEQKAHAAVSALPFALLLLGLGLALVAVPEVLYLRDNFGTRMNTIFKFYYQAWLLFAVVSAYAVGVVFLRQQDHASRRGVHGAGPIVVLRGLTGLSVLLVMGGVLFPIAGVYSKTGGLRADALTLDASAYMRREAPDMAAAADWIAQNTAPGTVVLEGKGSSYHAAHNRISTTTGRPTLLGWDGHQAQWRGEAYGAMAHGRPEAIERIYRTGTSEEILATLTEWNIGFVVIGPSEVELYGISESRIAELRRVLEPVFVSGQVVILRPSASVGQ